MTQHKHSKALFASLIVGVWLLGTAVGFWWFEFRDLRAFGGEASTRFFDGDALRRSVQAIVPASSGVARPVVLHFWEPDCSCSRFSNQHVRELIANYVPKGFRFMVVAHAASPEREAALRRQAQQVFGAVEVVFSHDAQLDAHIPSSPAAVILDAKKGLAYFGPYSSGAVCSAGKGSFVEAILDEVAQGRNPAKVNTLAYGCFCGWARSNQHI